jgi:hypothetical protein
MSATLNKFTKLASAIEANVRNELRNDLEEEVRDQLRDELSEEIRDELRENLTDDIREELRETYQDIVRDELREELEDDARDALASELESEVREELLEQLHDEAMEEATRDCQSRLHDLATAIEEDVRALRAALGKRRRPTTPVQTTSSHPIDQNAASGSDNTESATTKRQRTITSNIVQDFDEDAQEVVLTFNTGVLDNGKDGKNDDVVQIANTVRIAVAEDRHVVVSSHLVATGDDCDSAAIDRTITIGNYPMDPMDMDDEENQGENLDDGQNEVQENEPLQSAIHTPVMHDSSSSDDSDSDDEQMPLTTAAPLQRAVSSSSSSSSDSSSDDEEEVLQRAPAIVSRYTYWSSSSDSDSDSDEVPTAAVPLQRTVSSSSSSSDDSSVSEIPAPVRR